MYKWIFGAVFLLSALTSVVVVKYGLGPRPIRIIKPSNFKSAEVFGYYIFRQLYQPLKTTQQVVIGLNSKNKYEVEIMESLLTSLQNDTGNLPEVLITEPQKSFKQSFKQSFKTPSKENYLNLTFINLSDVESADKLILCDEIKDHAEWFKCSKSQKIRQINSAKKIDLNQPVGLLERVSKNDIVIYFKK